MHILSFGLERSIPPSLASRGTLRLADHTSVAKGDRRRDRPSMDSGIAVVGMLGEARQELSAISGLLRRMG